VVTGDGLIGVMVCRRIVDRAMSYLGGLDVADVGFLTTPWLFCLR